MKSTHRAGDPESKVITAALGKKAFTAAEVKAMCGAVGVEYRDGDEKNVVEYIASTETADREGDIMVLSGGDFKTFLTNPVFLWAHDLQSIPLGNVISIRIDGSKLIATVLYHCITVESKDLCELAKLGHIKAVSIGFRSKQNGIKFPTDAERAAFGMRPGGVIFQAWELYELSQCPVGMNQEALKVRSLGNKTIALLKGEDPSNILEEEEFTMKPEDQKAITDAMAEAITKAIPAIVTAMKAVPVVDPAAPIPAVAPVVPAPATPETALEKPADPSKAFAAFAKGNTRIVGQAPKTGLEVLNERFNRVKV